MAILDGGSVPAWQTYENLLLANDFKRDGGGIHRKVDEFSVQRRTSYTYVNDALSTEVTVDSDGEWRVLVDAAVQPDRSGATKTNMALSWTIRGHDLEGLRRVIDAAKAGALKLVITAESRDTLLERLLGGRGWEPQKLPGSTLYTRVDTSPPPLKEPWKPRYEVTLWRDENLKLRRDTRTNSVVLATLVFAWAYAIAGRCYKACIYDNAQAKVTHQFDRRIKQW